MWTGKRSPVVTTSAKSKPENTLREFTREELLEVARTAPEALVDVMLALQEQVKQLRAELKELKEQVAQNSRNSNKPPSSDGLNKPAVPKSLREKTDRKPGGQQGHEGRTLRQVEKPDHVIVHALEKCPCGHCQGVPLLDQPVIGHEKRQVFDLPPQRLEVTEHRVEIKHCPCSGHEVRAAFPEHVKAATQYGTRFQGLLVYLNQQQLLPFARVGQLCEDLFGQLISLGTLSEVNARTYESLKGFEAQVVTRLQEAQVINVDESGLRVEGKLHWIHTACTKTLTHYSVHANRGREAMDAAGILSSYQGWMVHDFWSPYLQYEQSAHALCNEHILRELKFLFEEQEQQWAGKMMELLLNFHELSKAESQISGRRIESCHRRYRALLEHARLEHPRRDKAQKRGKQTKACNLLERLEEYEHCILAFLSDPLVPFTNNQAEQDIRMIKVREKISGCFRTLTGARCFARIRGFFSTARKQGRDLLESVTQALLGNPFQPVLTG